MSFAVNNQRKPTNLKQIGAPSPWRSSSGQDRIASSSTTRRCSSRKPRAIRTLLLVFRVHPPYARVSASSPSSSSPNTFANHAPADRHVAPGVRGARERPARPSEPAQCRTRTCAPPFFIFARIFFRAPGLFPFIVRGAFFSERPFHDTLPRVGPCPRQGTPHSNIWRRGT